MIRVLVADDHLMFREALRNALFCSGVEVVAEVSHDSDLGEAVSALRPHVVLLECRAAGDLSELIRTIRKCHAGAQVIVLSGFGSCRIAARAAGAGARGYALKSTRIGALAAAIVAVASGAAWLEPSLPRKVVETFVAAATRGSDGPHTPSDRSETDKAESDPSLERLALAS